jgi:hypothetical protein
MQDRRASRKFDDIQRASTAVPRAANAVHQSGMFNRYKPFDLENQRAPQTSPYTTVDASMMGQEMHRRPGQRVETAAFMPHFTKLTMDAQGKMRDRGMKTEDSLSASIYNDM